MFFEGVLAMIMKRAIFIVLLCNIALFATPINRPHFIYKEKIPQIPLQKRDYINIVNYNIRKSFCDEGTINEWKLRKDAYFQTLRFEDESKHLIEEMHRRLKQVFSKHFSDYSEQTYNTHPLCSCCKINNRVPYVVHKTKYFQINLKALHDEKGVLYGNFPYPYRLVIALKRHATIPNDDEWLELKQILHVVQNSICEDLGAEYVSFASLQDVFYKKKNMGENKDLDPHFFLHCIFRFPKGVQLLNTPFKDSNPYDQFLLSEKNLVKEKEPKPSSNYIYKQAPDIIATQELTFEQAEDLKEEFHNYQFIGYNAFDGKALSVITADDWIDEIVAIGYRTDRFELLDHGVKWLSETPDKPSAAPGASRNRIVVWVKFHDFVTNKTFFLFNSHYDHLGWRELMVNVEVDAIQSIAKDHLWFSCGERFYPNTFNGEALYNQFLQKASCQDIRDCALVGHYGESGTWGGFEKDPYACKVINGAFECGTLDVIFTNKKQGSVLLTYHINGAFDPETNRIYSIEDPVDKGYRLASDHFMSGFYFLFDN